MFLHVHDKRTLKELQDDFNLFYPYLRLEFFSRPHGSGAHSAEKHRLNSYMQVVAVRKSHRNGAVEINDWHTVKEVEQMLQQEYQLPVQIYHYTKAGWIETTVTDDVTLKELNEQGRREAGDELHPHFNPEQFK